jgi:hypothetical protein
MDQSSKAQVDDPAPSSKETLQKRQAVNHSLDRPIASFQWHETTNENVYYYRFTEEGANLGVIHIRSFAEHAIIKIVRNLLANELQNTSGLVFDVRGNPGGIITADLIAQLFVPDPKPMKFRAQDTVLNRKMFNYDRFFRDFVNSKSKQWQTDPVLLNDLEEYSQFGMIYDKPVVVYTDSLCYSACELFAASMQDNGAAIIVGEDGKTGGGGASVRTAQSLQRFAPDDLPEIPYSDSPSVATEISIAWAQMVRQGINQGKLVENVGVESDVVIRATIDDIRSIFSNSHFRRIAELFTSEIQKTWSMSITPTSPYIFTGVTFLITLQGLSNVRLDVIDVKTKEAITLVEVDVQDYEGKINIAIPKKEENENRKFLILGLQGDEVVFKTVKYTY